MVQLNKEEQQEKQIVDGGADLVKSPRPEDENIKVGDDDVIYLEAQIVYRNNDTEVFKRIGAPEPYPPKDKSYEKNDTPLFIGISAFRDNRCSKTLYNLFTKAKYPERINIGVVQQWKFDEDDDCLGEYCKMVEELNPEMWKASGGVCPHYHQVKVMRLDYRESQGPCYGRHFQSYMLRDEEFCLQLDSHMDVILDWDKELMDMWGRTNNEYGILSVYVSGIENLPQNGTLAKYAPHLCELTFEGKSKKEPRYEHTRNVRGLKAPLLTTAFAGGFNFGKCHSWKAVPYDPGLKKVFNGEEFSMAARLWTLGYDFYTPDRSVVGHDYGGSMKEGFRGAKPMTWIRNDASNARAVRAKSYDHLWKLLGIGEIGDPGLQEVGEDYGLGNLRSWHQMQEFIGMNLTTLERFTDSCKNLEWVPFNEGPWPPTVNILQGQYWKERKEVELSRKQLKMEEEVSVAKP